MSAYLQATYWCTVPIPNGKRSHNPTHAHTRGDGFTPFYLLLMFCPLKFLWSDGDRKGGPNVIVQMGQGVGSPRGGGVGWGGSASQESQPHLPSSITRPKSARHLNKSFQVIRLPLFWISPFFFQKFALPARSYIPTTTRSYLVYLLLPNSTIYYLLLPNSTIACCLPLPLMLLPNADSTTCSYLILLHTSTNTRPYLLLPNSTTYYPFLPNSTTYYYLLLPNSITCSYTPNSNTYLLPSLT
jgi:hypothetical protein